MSLGRPARRALRIPARAGGARKTLLVSVAALALVSSTRATQAAGAEVEQCVAAAEQGQQLRDDGKYGLAHDAFSRCESVVCPAVVRQDCMQWLAEIDANMPSIIVAAEDRDGRDLQGVEMTIDGVALASSLDAKPLSVDPGDHLVHCKAPEFAPVEHHVVIRVGEKKRILRVRCEDEPALAQRPQGAAPVPTTAAPLAAEPAAPPPIQRSPPPAATWAFGGVAVAAFGSEAYFGLTAISRRNADLASGGCAPHCTQSERDSIFTRLVVSDVSLAVGLASAGLATYFFVRPRVPAGGLASPTPPSVALAPRPGGAVATLTGGF